MIDIKKGPEKTFVPRILLSNVMSLATKIDEVRHYAEYANLDLVCLIETWLQGHIHDNIVTINSFNLVRLDRKESVYIRWWMYIYIKYSIQYSSLDDLTNSSFGVLCVKIRPTWLPRGTSNIIVGTVYHPPSSNNPTILNYLMNCLLSIESRHPKCGILLLGDFNKLKPQRCEVKIQLQSQANCQLTNQGLEHAGFNTYESPRFLRCPG